MDTLVALRSAVRAALSKFSPGDLILVAVSGGADSLALAESAKLEADKLSLKLQAINIDHQLQPGSAAQAETVKNQLSFPCEIRKVEVKITDGLEASARRARYEALISFAKESGAVAVLLGHTKDDQAETVLLGLARGSGARSLSGMAQETGIFLRPFLNITREQTVASCKELNLKPWNDPHNDDLNFLRVRARKKVLPIMESELGPGISEALVRSANLLRDDADALDLLAEEFWKKDSSLEVSTLLELPKAIRTRVLRIALFEAGVTQLSADQVSQVEALISNWKGQGEVSLPAGVKVSRISGRLTLSN
ncbi:MAG: tRNA lysidine(34) synthetase TilS [Candidatus Nanopelagicaceae bacterium]|jgi:tRNA(Ile)-lysidine synthase